MTLDTRNLTPGTDLVFAPDRGGAPIPDLVKRRAVERLRRYAEQHFAGRYTRLDIRFRGQVCSIEPLYRRLHRAGAAQPFLAASRPAGDGGGVRGTAAQHADASLSAALLR